ncbi:hypothetical protein ROZALSC1DRAFT_28744 [Rozella allomycis CSF55]|uniref:2-(3-amino-3-carboxypropyl)histidine synthase subunit 1 n=1 Tax=Rozella allomycis (strain CSF55) TaxID=988480 RepID=A0A075B0Y6_ROZAC|nr:Diphthamide synthesis, eukaryotic DPH1/archaeal DPH2 domain-containing protein [Rozella allomycis CSF55]RKP19677.1 hypothetical protein ROZALSC1DRAFT_28744 [Rozella allomycis CSF55]|eukprot:EPZ36058.1 Diphthamide synthesis, eukaryotic DPH1/archaeal DPH2 domain-containing protein [Rozella allomycis CSF55]
MLEETALVQKKNDPKRNVKTFRKLNQIPDDILENKELNDWIAQMPKNYNFEIHKTIWMCKKNQSKRVALQFPEGLLMYACIISDILEKFAQVETVIMGDVTYGACCIDDFTATALGCDFMVHYGHSCLVPIDVTKIKTMYVFVDIKFDISHFVEHIRTFFHPDQKICFVSTVQFLTSLHAAKNALSDFPKIFIPQIKPLSPGEILGCTAPKLDKDTDAIVYLGDGRFHLEAIMIANPSKCAYKYDPYGKTMTREYYEIEEMHKLRKEAITKARQAKSVGLILGTLGRQGNPRVLETIEKKLKDCGKKYTRILMSEIFASKITQFKDIDTFVQVACPRLSIDWGYSYPKPLLTPFEMNVCLDQIEWQSVYPMDFYAKDSLGPWTPNNLANKLK